MTHTPSTPANPAQGVSGQDVRTVCEWLANHVGNISLMDWNPCANVLLQAADRLDAIEARCSVEQVAKDIAFAGRMEHDLSADPDDFWDHTVEDSRARYRAMAIAAIGAGGQAVAYKYRWKIEGEYVNWRYSDASNYHRSLDGYEEIPLFTHPAPIGRAVAWRISCPEDEIYGRGPDTVRFHPLSPNEIASGYTQQPLFSNPPAQPGWRMVPEEPTEAMIEAANRVDWCNEDERATTVNVWHSMLSATPLPGGAK